jgi:hypothetical protein
MTTQTGTCELCGRDEMNLTFHHLIPQTLHRNEWFQKNFSRREMQTRGLNVCRECHHAIHQFIPREKDLGRNYNTREALMSHDKIARHVKWIAGRPFQRHRVR